jgi:hypothetical protein
MTARKDTSYNAIEELMKRRQAVALGDLLRTLRTRSRMTVYRRLRSLGYLTSFTHTGRYYTIAGIPDFDEDGLWFHGGVGFSRVGTLKETVVALVERSEGGRTHGELEALVRVRVHNTLLRLVEEARIGRERLDRLYLYVSAEDVRRAEQIARRRALVSGEVAVALPTELVIEVLVEALHAGEGLASAAVVAARLCARGSAATEVQVAQVYGEFALVPGKKTEEPHSGPSRS